VTTVTAADHVQLGVQTASGVPDTSGNRPFIKELPAVRCAFRCVVSIMIRSGLPPLRANARENLVEHTLRATLVAAHRSLFLITKQDLTIRRSSTPAPMQRRKIALDPTHLRLTHGEVSSPRR
jgi:hypothetical protein